MIQICEKNKCTGCWACFNKCPKQCITMKIGDNLGHLYPSIDQQVCIECGACIKICPANNSQEKKKPLIAYAGWDKDINEYKSSTSGGAASAISRYIIKSGGVVYGCAMLPNIEVKHIRVSKEEDLYQLKGSKYVQSSIGFVYKDVLTDLKEGKRVLFIGTPCQVAAAKNVVGKWGGNLYTIDLICHGVPSVNLLRAHAKRKIGKIENIVAKFRDNVDMCLQFRQQKNNAMRTLYSSNLWKDRYADIFFNAFIDGFTYRESCHTCYYADSKRVSDLTIGDFWGLGREQPFLQKHPFGCSVLLPITDKGVELINGIKESFYLFDRSISEAVNGNDQLQHPVQETERISFFLKLNSFIGIDAAYRICTIDKLIKLKFYKIRVSIALAKRKFISSCKRK